MIKSIIDKIKTLIGKVKSNPLSAAVILFVGGCWLYMQLSAWQIFHNFYQCSASMAGAGWRIFGLILSAASIFWGYELATDGNYVTKDDTGNAIILAVLVVLSFLAYMGFTTGYGCVN
jgi:hypothetical protein